MKLFIYALFFFLITYNAHAQTMVVKYKNSSEIYQKSKKRWAKLSKEKKAMYSKIMKKYDDDTAKLTYTLKFNNFESSFETDPILSKDSNLFDSNQSYYYSDLRDSTALERKLIAQQEFIVKKGLPKWEILKDRKIINGYHVFKATAKVKRYASNGDIKYDPVEAWFTPEIPLSFGPKGFNGLPGLIIDLKFLGSHYYVIDIDLTKREEEIEKPTKGKKINHDEVQKIYRKLFERYNN